MAQTLHKCVLINLLSIVNSEYWLNLLKMSFLYPVKGSYEVSHIYIQTITCCYPFKVPTHKIFTLHVDF